MSEPITVTTPDGHVTITARPWTADQRPQVIAGLRQIIDSLYRALPELCGSDTVEQAASDLALRTAIDNEDVADVVLQTAPDTELAQADCHR
ncbi:hypothetical protein [Nocardia sp. CA-119907]|uniref:hypothetical protein n=1 Tax=Nocardia sp. CA-119907 TaxID=3239973 RepID=UPI003D97E6D1